MEFSFDPGVLLWIFIAEFLYLRALRILAQRGVRVPRLQKVFWHIGLSLWVIGLMSPIDTLGDRLLSAHMAEHLLIADIAAPFLVAGMRNPILAFLLPKDVLKTVARWTRLRNLFRTMRRPLVALPIYALVLYGWHFGFAFEAAVRHPIIHAAQHASFIGIGILVWWSALEPKRRRPKGDLWKIGHILAARMLGMFLGMSFVITRVPIYTGVYGSGDRGFGLEAVYDQQLAGALMVVTDIFMMSFALIFFFWRAAKDEDEAPQLQVVAENDAAELSRAPSRLPLRAIPDVATLRTIMRVLKRKDRRKAGLSRLGRVDVEASRLIWLGIYIVARNSRI